MIINNEPYEHLVIEKFLNESDYKDVKIEAMRLHDIGKTDQSYHLNSKKSANHRYSDYEVEIGERLKEIYTGKVKELAENLLGYKVLTDIEHNWGGGFHFLERGGFLNMHVDFNIHPHTGLKRVANAIIYLNDGWESNWGGNLKLLNKRTREEISYTPEGNRLVIFPVRDDTWHGNPERVNSDRVRASFAMYFYIKMQDETETAHSTIYIDEARIGVNTFYNLFWKWAKFLIPKSFIFWIKKKILK
ncbi:2OG-Fe(II) oxygenase [Porticoccaceae bacterium]|nr:2OG-Fe(II) oxygenase [Porticoccaceae bacterium]